MDGGGNKFTLLLLLRKGTIQSSAGKQIPTQLMVYIL
tara:strand:+ start:20371 stop:20481 length:111 start_codon:yes stop_codon:yes gene_type:complete